MNITLFLFLVTTIILPPVLWYFSKFKYDFYWAMFSMLLNLPIALYFIHYYGLIKLDSRSISIFILFIVINILMSSSVIDIKYMELPDINNLIVFILGVLYLIIARPEPITLYILSSAILFIITFIMACVSNLGGGDIKLLTAIGLFLPVDLALKMLFYSCVLGIIYAIPKKIYNSKLKNKQESVEKCDSVVVIEETLEKEKNDNTGHESDEEIDESKLFPFGQFIVLSFFIIIFIGWF